MNWYISRDDMWNVSTRLLSISMKAWENKWFTNGFDEIDSMSITQNLSFARNRRGLAKDFNAYREYNSTWMRFMNG